MRRNKKGLTLFLSTLKSVLTFIKISPQTLVLFVVSRTACERATRTLFSAPKTSEEIDSLFECMTSLPSLVPVLKSPLPGYRS